MQIERFEIDVETHHLDDLANRLERTRFPEWLDSDGWDYGTSTAYLRELIEYWHDGFDWATQQQRLNSFEQYTAQVDGRRLHFLHQPGEGADPLPIVLTHGWPSGYHEMTKLVDRLAHPSRHGGDPNDSFTVVVPSLPGFGYSDPIEHGGYFDAGQAIHQLMVHGLGYDRFGLHGTGAGAFVNGWITLEHPESVVGYHTHDPNLMPPMSRGEPSSMSEDERAYQQRAAAWGAREGAYGELHRTKPQSLGNALADSPSGLASWLIEKHRSWSDCDGDIERRYTKDELLTGCTWYWVTNSITSSIRLYYERSHRDPQVAPGRRFEVPTGIAMPRDVATFPTRRSPRAVLERTHDIQHWVDLPSGGHFASWEEPDLVAQSIRTFFGSLR